MGAMTQFAARNPPKRPGITPMYQKIVVAYDGTGPCETALRQAGELARLCKAELHLLGVVVSSGRLILDPAAVSYELLAAERHGLEGGLVDTLSDFASQGISATSCIRDGDAVHEITAYIHKIKADLVIVGHSNKGLLERWIEGSIGRDLLNDPPCSLLIAVNHPAQSQ